ncbi:hypothetical protein [Microbacterium sp. RG1]|nr:hypothetical protein [Microbacterium sp. RG1]
MEGFEELVCVGERDDPERLTLVASGEQLADGLEGVCGSGRFSDRGA